MDRRNKSEIADKYTGTGWMVFTETGARVSADYEIILWNESTFDGHPLGHAFKGRVWSSEDGLLAFRYAGKNFILEMDHNRRLSLFIADQTGAVEHCPGPVEGFPGING